MAWSCPIYNVLLALPLREHFFSYCTHTRMPSYTRRVDSHYSMMENCGKRFLTRTHSTRHIIIKKFIMTTSVNIKHVQFNSTARIFILQLDYNSILISFSTRLVNPVFCSQVFFCSLQYLSYIVTNSIMLACYRHFSHLQLVRRTKRTTNAKKRKKHKRGVSNTWYSFNWIHIVEASELASIAGSSALRSLFSVRLLVLLLVLLRFVVVAAVSREVSLSTCLLPALASIL